MRMHHAAILARDFDASLRFWRDGLGLEKIMHMRFPGEWRALFNADADTIHSAFLGDPSRPDAGLVEILETLARLGDLGLGGEPRQIVNSGVRMAVVEDPDGVRVELIDIEAMPDMSREDVR